MAERGGSVSGATEGVDGTDTSGVALPSDVFPAAALGTVFGSDMGPSGTRLPSKLIAGDRPTAMPSKPMLAISLDIRIARLSAAAPGWVSAPSRAAPTCWAYFHRYPGKFGVSRLPRLGPRRELTLAELHLEGASHRIYRDDVAVAEEPDRPADGSFRTHMADAKTPRRAGEAPVGD